MNKNISLLYPCTLVTIFIIFLTFGSSLRAQEDYQAVSNTDPKVAIEDLVLILLPLSRHELEIEAAAWYETLSNTIHDVTKLEIESQQLGRQAKLMDNAADGVQDIIDAKQSGDAEDIADAKATLMETGQDMNVHIDKINEVTTKANESAVVQVVQKEEELVQEKSTLISSIAILRLEQARLVTRLDVVLDSLESKGGDVTELRLYSVAVSHLKINVHESFTAWKTASEWLKSDDGGILMSFNLLRFILAIVLINLFAKLTGKLTARLTRRNSASLLLVTFLEVAVRRSVFFIGLIMMLPLLGINTGPLLALIGAAGLIIGLALQGTLSNFASGMLILIYRPYDISDTIEIGLGGVMGTVKSMTLMSTTIKTADNKLVTVPNNNVWSDSITNITGSDVRRVDLAFRISYGDNFTVAQKIMGKILADHPLVLVEPKPNIRVHELAGSSVNFICRPWVKTSNYWQVYWDITETVKLEFDAQGVSIPFPQQDVHLFSAGDLALNNAHK